VNLAKEWRTFRAVFWRNLKLFTSYSTWIVATLIWPIPLLAVNIYSYKAFGTDASISSIISQDYGISNFAGMIIIGTIVYLLYNRLLWGAGISLQSERWMGTIEALFVTPANRMTVLFASGVSSLVEGAWWIGCIFALSWMIFGVEPSISSWPAIILGVVSTMIALISVGVFFASFFVLTRAADQMASALQAPIRFFSGVVFPVSALPQLLQFVSYILPVTYGIQAMRKAVLTGGNIASISLEIVSLYVFALVLTVAGYFTLKALEKEAKRRGTLYMY
jgi:ABC-2 type transport system permease protein